MMKVVEIRVPRELIIDTYEHPEDYGELMVILKNKMYTDVYTDENGDYVTITNDPDLIRYLKVNSHLK